MSDWIAELTAIVKVAASPEMDKQVQQIANGVSTGLKNAFTQIFNVALPAISAAGFAKVTNDLAAKIENLGRASQRLNIPVEKLDQWSMAMQMGGTSTEAFIGTLENLDRQLKNISRGQRNGLWTEMVRGYLPGWNGRRDDPLGYLQDLIKTGNLIRNNTNLSEQGRGLEMKRFIQSMQESGAITDKALLDAIANGDTRLEKRLALARKLGTFNKENEKAARDLRDALRTLQIAFERSLLPLFTYLAPKIQWVAEKFIDLKENMLAIYPVIMRVAAGPLLAGLKKLMAFFIATPLGRSIAMWTAIGAVFEDLETFVNGGKSAFEGLWKILAQLFGGFDKLKEKVEWMKDNPIEAFVKTWLALQGVKFAGKGLWTLGKIGMSEGGFAGWMNGAKGMAKGLKLGKVGGAIRRTLGIGGKAGSVAGKVIDEVTGASMSTETMNVTAGVVNVEGGLGDITSKIATGGGAAATAGTGAVMGAVGVASGIVAPIVAAAVKAKQDYDDFQQNGMNADSVVNNIMEAFDETENEDIRKLISGKDRKAEKEIDFSNDNDLNFDVSKMRDFNVNTTFFVTGNATPEVVNRAGEKLGETVKTAMSVKMGQSAT